MRRPILRTALAAGLALTALLAWAAPIQAETRTHVVQPGETLYRIALKYGVTVQAIQAANGLNNYVIYVGQRLMIPDANAPAAPVAVNSNVTHIVQPGETLFLIGLKYNIPWTRIQAANGLAGEKIYTGQRLTIPLSGTPGTPEATPTPAPTEPTPEPPTPAPTETATPEPPTETATAETTPTELPPTETATPGSHIVQRGESLFSIGVKYGLLWTTIQQANGLGGTTIYPGQALVIPPSDAGYTAPPVVVVAPPPPPGTGKRFLVVLSEQRLYAYEDDTMVRTTLISSGVPSYPTVTGTFSIYLRYTSARMIGPGYNLPNVPYVMYFHRSYGLHGTYWHSNFGHPMSHGCVNMPTSEAEWAYHWSTYGTPVIVRW